MGIVPYAPAHAAGCAELLASLPEWFGRPEANAMYLADLERLPSWVAVDGATAVGAITMTECHPGSFEVHFLAVARGWHGRGVGSALVGQVEREAFRRGGYWLHVKTVGPSCPDPNYARTREFYGRQGFAPLFESTALWDAQTPALVLVKRVTDGS